MKKLFNLHLTIGLAALVISGCSPKTTAITLPERPPTFDELMRLADSDLAKDGLIKAYIYSQADGVGFQRIMGHAETGDIEAQVMACYLLASGIGVEKNEQLGFSLCEKAAAKGSIQAKTNLIYRDFNSDPNTMNWQETYDAFDGLMESAPGRAHRGLQFLYRQDHPKASMPMMYEHLFQAIKYKNTNAMLALSEFDLNIHPVKYRNYARAERNLKQAYALNDFDAGYKLAIQYREGSKLTQNLPAYETMIKRMAAFLHPKSMGELAYMHASGKGAKQDQEKSNALHAKAASFGNPYSQEMIGYQLLTAPQGSADYEMGLKYLTTHADNGNMNAMMALANHYAKPDIDDPNNKSITWFAHAAMGGNQTAQETLGFSMMETGYIKEMQPYIAFLEAAQKHGHPDASYLLARHYRAASGVKRNLKKAKAILNKVAHLDDPRITEEIQIVEDHIIYFSGKSLQ